MYSDLSHFTVTVVFKYHGGLCLSMGRANFASSKVEKVLPKESPFMAAAFNSAQSMRNLTADLLSNEHCSAYNNLHLISLCSEPAWV